jgi:c-di-GMP-binding flagellar brake protein YcgR
MVQDDVSESLSVLTPGSPILVEVSIPPSHKIRFKSIFIGFLPKHFMLIQLPDFSRNVELAGNVKQGVACTVRSIVEQHEGAIVAFVTSIERTINIPAKMIILNIPQKVVVRTLRKETRIETQLNFEATVNNSSFKGVMENLSLDGCLLNIKKGKTVVINKDDNITLSITDTALREVTSIKGIVCNLKSSLHIDYFGIKFEEESYEIIKTLLMKVLFSH